MKNEVATSKSHPYPTYKDSGIEWLGQIPEHWDIKAVWHLFQLGRGRVISHEDIANDPGSYPVYSSQTENNGILGYLGTYDFNGEYLTWTTDGANAGTVFPRKGKFNCTNVCGTLLAKKGAKVNTTFAAYALALATDSYVRYDINPKLMNNVMRGIRIAAPPLPEQQLIADFLDEKCGRIDGLIKKKERLIELLKRKRSAIISQTVMKGLDCLYLPLDLTPVDVNKIIAAGDRKVPWLSRCPVASEFKPIKYLCSINVASLPETTRWDTEILYIDISSIDSDGNIASPDIMIFENAPSRARRIVKNNDVLISTVRTYLRAIAYIEQAPSNFICSTGFAVIAAGQKVDPKFLFYWMRSALFVDEIMARSVGVNYPAINASEIGNLPFPMIGLDEQRRIAKFLDLETQKIDSLIRAANMAIEKLKEYRSAIITAAVTGKIDVRGEV